MVDFFNINVQKFWIKCRNKYFKYIVKFKYKNWIFLGVRNVVEI